MAFYPYSESSQVEEGITMEESVGCACGVQEDDTEEALSDASVQHSGEDQRKQRSAQGSSAKDAGQLAELS